MQPVTYILGAPASLGARSPTGVSIHPLTPGAPDAASIVTLLNIIATDASRDGNFRMLADSILGPPRQDNNLKGIASFLADWVKKRVNYVPDPAGTEFVKDPKMMLSTINQYGVDGGDCDDHCVLFMSLCLTYGIPCRIVAVKIDPAGQYFDHVICETSIGVGTQTVDLCAKDVPTPNYSERVLPAKYE